MNIIEKIYQMRDEELNQITSKDKQRLLELYPKYSENSQLEELVSGNPKLENAFEQYCTKISTESSHLNKKFYLAGLKDGINITKFAKGDEINDC